MQVITDAKELRKHTYKKVRNTNIFPKKDRLLADKMFDEAADLVADLMEANDHLLTDPEERELRFRAQRSALRNCRKLIDNIEFAHENLPGVTDDAFAFWSRLAAGVKNQTAAWYKKIEKGLPSWSQRPNSSPVGYALFFRAGSANNARNVNTDGTLNRNNAYNGNNGLRPASMDRPTY